MLAVIILLISHWYLSLFCQTFFLHRYSAHQMFKLNNFWEKFFFILTYISQGPSFLNPRAYSILHQRHHYYSDTEKDPHSPHFSKNPIQMMMSTLKEYQVIKNLTSEDLENFIEKGFPIWPAFERFVNFANKFLSFKILWFVVYLLIYIWIDPPLWAYALIPFHLIVGPIQGAAVNWFGHTFGYRNYPLQDKSTNAFPFEILLMGELFQNNHHKYPKSTNFAVRWFEFDPTHYIIIVFKYLRILQQPTKVSLKG